MKIEGKEYRTIWFDEKNQAVKIIDQTKLPHQFIIKDLKTVKDAINAIKVMEVRWAPLIGGTASYGIVLFIMEKNEHSLIMQSAKDFIQSRKKKSKIDEILLGDLSQYSRLKDEINLSVRGLPNIFRLDTTERTCEEVVSKVKDHLYRSEILTW